MYRLSAESGASIVQRLRERKLHDGDRGRGVLRQMHQDALYKILQIRGQQNCPVTKVRGKVYGHIQTSAHALVSAILRDDDSVRAYKRVRELVRDLQSIPIVLENVYTWQGLRGREELTLLSNVRWSEKGRDEEPRLPEAPHSAWPPAPAAFVESPAPALLTSPPGTARD